MRGPGAETTDPQDLREWRRYHGATAHTWASVYGSPHYLDWDNQPDPFRRYAGAPLIELPRAPHLPEQGTRTTLGAIGADPAHAPAVTRELVSALLWHSLAISAWKQLEGDPSHRWSLRVHPSSGNLHPTEAYVALAAPVDLEPGLYHYRADVHALELRARGAAAAGLLDAEGGYPIALALTSVFWREAWKYRSRAYRYCLLDAGHAVASVLAAAAALGCPGQAFMHFDDGALRACLGVAVGDEQPLALLGLGPRGGRSGPAVPARALAFLGAPNELSQESIEYAAIHRVHEATELAGTPSFPPLPDAPAPAPALAPALTLPRAAAAGVRDDPFATVVRRRRSATDFERAARCSLAELGALLEHAQAPFRADFRGSERPRNWVRLVVYAHAVDGLPPGAYDYDPSSHALHLRKAGDQRDWARSLSLGQDIAADALAAFSLLGDLDLAGRTLGNRGYRDLHVEAGAIGHFLYLGAEALGWNATGIGAFFDEEVHRHLEVEPGRAFVLYHFSVGRSVADPRIVQFATEPLPFPRETE